VKGCQEGVKNARLPVWNASMLSGDGVGQRFDGTRGWFGRVACPEGIVAMRGNPAWRGADRGRVSFELGVAAGALTMIVAALIAAATFSPGQERARLAVMAAAVAVFSAVVGGWRSSLPVALVAYLLFNGFLVHRRGELRWDQATGLRDMSVIAAAAGLGIAVGWWRRSRPDPGLVVIPPLSENTAIEKEKHNG
jgi:hypothetical protein